MEFGALAIPGIAMVAIGVLCTRRTVLQRAFEEAAPIGRDSPPSRYVKMAGVVRTPDSVVIREPLLNQSCAWFSIKAEKYRPLDIYFKFRTIGS
jgi:hypothetical protein